MRKLIVVFGLLGCTAGAVDGIESDCAKVELKALRSTTVVAKIAPEGSVTGLDCTVLKMGKGSEKLLALFVVEAPSGVETHVAVFARGGFGKDSAPSFKSDSLGFDSYPLMAHGRRRLIFVLPPAEGKTVAFYAVTQTGPSDIKLTKHVLNLESNTMADEADHTWPVSASLTPKFLREQGKWRVILRGKIVDL